MRRLMKFLHTLGAVGLMGGMAALLVGAVLAPPAVGAAGLALLMKTEAAVAGWIVLPSMGLTVITGLLAIAITPGFHEAGWAWAKAASGLLIFEGALHVAGAIRDQAAQGVAALTTAQNVADLGRLLNSERSALWVLIAVSAANIALGVWRPRLPPVPV